MPFSFATLTLADSIRQIPINRRLLTSGGTAGILDYIRRFNPFTMETLSVLGERGYAVTLPLTESEWTRDAPLRTAVLQKTTAALLDYGVAVVSWDGQSAADIAGSVLPVAEGLLGFCFLCAGVVGKVMRLCRKPKEAADVLVIGGSRSLTHCLLDNLYPYVRFISLLHRVAEDADFFASRAEAVQAEAGLQMPVEGRNRYLLANADIIFNCDPSENAFDRYYKRGAAYFELGRSRRCAALSAKRPDMLCVDRLPVDCGGKILSPALFEMLLFVKSPAFATILREGYHPSLLHAARRDAQALGRGWLKVTPTSF